LVADRLEGRDPFFPCRIIDIAGSWTSAMTRQCLRPVRKAIQFQQDQAIGEPP
jgi:hypothetical protein